MGIRIEMERNRSPIDAHHHSGIERTMNGRTISQHERAVSPDQSRSGLQYRVTNVERRDISRLDRYRRKCSLCAVRHAQRGSDRQLAWVEIVTKLQFRAPPWLRRPISDVLFEGLHFGEAGGRLALASGLTRVGTLVPWRSLRGRKRGCGEQERECENNCPRAGHGRHPPKKSEFPCSSVDGLFDRVGQFFWLRALHVSVRWRCFGEYGSN